MRQRDVLDDKLKFLDIILTLRKDLGRLETERDEARGSLLHWLSKYGGAIMAAITDPADAERMNRELLMLERLPLPRTAEEQ